MLGRILVFLGGLLVVALFAALLIPYFIDWTDFRRNFEDQASRILGKKVVVHGRVEARLLPFPSVTLHDVRAGMDADGSPQIQVARFSMDAELAPFISGEARIFDMRIEEPKARIRLLKDGTLDWTRGSRAVIPAKTVVLENVSIQGGQIEFIDEQSGRNRTVTGLNADMSAKSLLALGGQTGGRRLMDMRDHFPCPAANRMRMPGAWACACVCCRTSILSKSIWTERLPPSKDARCIAVPSPSTSGRMTSRNHKMAS